MARRVLLHVGCPKTGTSFLQGVLWSNKAVLQRQGLLVPGPMKQHFRASLYVRNATRNRPGAAEITADWERLLEAIRRTDQDVLVSHELFSLTTAKQARRAVEAFGEGGADVHVLVTARDLARQIPAGWQQHVKQGSTHTLDGFARDVVQRGPRANVFWQAQDAALIARRWASAVGDDHVHVVTVPPKGADPTVLWTRFASVLGVDPDSADLRRTRGNESLGRVEVELLRHVNEEREKRPPAPENQVWFKDVLANGTLAKRPDKERFAVDPALHEQICAAAHDMVSDLKQHHYDVVGDLDDLIPGPQPEPGGDPSTVDERAMLQAATQTIIDLMDTHIGVAKELRRVRREHEQQQEQEAQRPRTRGLRRWFRR